MLTSSASYEFTNRVGKQLSAYRQAVRTYRPGFDPDESENYVHPLALAGKIYSWDGGPAAFKDFLITQCLRRTVAEARIRREEKIPPYAQVKEVARELRRKQTHQTIKSKQEELDLAYEEIEEMKEQMVKNHKEYDQILLEVEEEKEQVADELNEANDRIESLKSRIELLENTQSDIEVPIPKNFDELDDWSQKHLAGRVLVHSRAIRTAQSAEKEC